MILLHFSADDDESFVFGHFQPVFSVQQQPDGILLTFPGTSIMECLLRCSRMTECNSAAIEGTNTGQSSRGYCHLYRAPLKKSSQLEDKDEGEDKQYYNKNKLV